QPFTDVVTSDVVRVQFRHRGVDHTPAAWDGNHLGVGSYHLTVVAEVEGIAQGDVEHGGIVEPSGSIIVFVKHDTCFVAALDGLAAGILRSFPFFRHVGSVEQKGTV